MEKRLKAVLLLSLVFVVAVSCASCVPMLKTKPPLGEYIAVDFKKLITPMFIDDYKGKYVKVECRFWMVEKVPGGFRDVDYFAFMAEHPREDLPEHLTVIGPKAIADVYLSLKSGDRITLYGEMIQLTTRTLAGSQYRELAIVADKIEKK
jgi:hypothetical protein